MATMPLFVPISDTGTLSGALGDITLGSGGSNTTLAALLALPGNVLVDAINFSRAISY